MMNILMVGLGGCIGALSRYWLAGLINRCYPAVIFPWGTLVVNLLGCFLIGFLAGLNVSRQFLTEPLRLLLFTGILGGLTTFSAFGLETMVLFQDKYPLMALLNIVAQVVLGIMMVFVGHRLALAL